MESCKIKIMTPSGEIKRVITNHADINDLRQQIDIFLKEADEAIKAGHQLSITCSSCCNGIKFKNCFKSKIKTGDNKVTAI